MISCSLTNHAIENAGIRISQWRGWSEKRIGLEIIRRLPFSRVIGRGDEAYFRLERGNLPREKEMVCFMKDDVAIYVLRRNIFEKRFRVSTVYDVNEFSSAIKLGTYLEHKGQIMDLVA